MNNFPSKFKKGFSLVELLVILATIGLLAGLGVSRFHNVTKASHSSKLQTDVTTINRAISIYLANGGRLTDAKSFGFSGDPIEQKVLDKLKTRRNSFSSKTYSGVSGEMIDKRVAVRMQTADQAAAGELRAVWDPSSNQFAIQDSGTGVQEFFLNDELASYDYGVDEGRRASSFDVNPDNGWIWSYEEQPMPERGAGPTEIVFVPTPDNGAPGGGSGGSDPTGGGGGGGGGAGEEEPEPLRGLARPRITPPSGIYEASAFPLTITVENPNLDAPESWIMVSTNGGTYHYYEGPFKVPANTTVRAYAAGPPDRFTNSSSDYKYYITQLERPSFSPYPGNYPMTRYPMDVTIYHRNDSSAQVMYAVDDGPYQRYAAPLTVEAGSTLKAYVQSPSSEWVDSDARAGSYSGYKVNLRAPNVATSASEFDENVDTISVTIEQPSGNPDGSSELRYAVTEKDAPKPDITSYGAYTGSFDNTYAEYPNGFTVYAFARSLDEDVWNDGPVRSVTTSVDFFGVGVAKSTLFMLDFSGSMDQKAYQSTLTRLEVLKAEMNIGLAGLNENDQFGVLIFSSVPHWVTTGGLVKVTSEIQTLKMHQGTEAIKAQVNAVVDDAMDMRYTNFLRALSVVDQISPKPEQIIFLTDGTPTVGDGSTEDLNNDWLAGLAEIIELDIPVHTIGVDLRKQSRLDRLEYISDQTGGTSNLVGDPNLLDDEWAP